MNRYFGPISLCCCANTRLNRYPSMMLALSLAIGSSQLISFQCVASEVTSVISAPNSVYQQRLRSVEALLSAQQRIQGDKGSSSLAEEGAKLVRRAKDAASNGDESTAESLIEQAYQLTKMAIRELAQGRAMPPAEGVQLQPTADGGREAVAFDHLAASVKALLNASQRISREYHDSDRYHTLIQEVDELRIKAVGYRQDGQEKRGLGLLQQAYFMLQGALSEMRDGLTISEQGATMGSVAPAEADSGSQRVDGKLYPFEQRLASVDALIGAEQRLQQNAPTDKRREATPQRQRAIELYQQGREAEAYALLGQLYGDLQASIRNLEQGRSDVVTSAATTHQQEKASADFVRLNQSITALLSAQERIMSDAPEGELYKTVAGSARALQQVALTLHRSGADQEGMRYLKNSYAMLRDAISAMRGGQTLIRELSFATAEDEYLYEVDRNTTYRMLVELFTARQVEWSAVKQAQMDGYMDEALRLAQQATDLAKRSSFSDAVTLLEQSTEQMIRALRVAGVFLPG